MKAKILVFKVLAVVVAIGGALTSVHATLAPGFAHVKYTLVGQTFCTTTVEQCQSTGPTICVVQTNIGIARGWAHTINPANPCPVRLFRTGSGSGSIKTLPPGSVLIN